MKQLLGAYPISGENLGALPVRVIATAVEFYRTVLGFDLLTSDDETATLSRDDVRIGLVRKPNHQPSEAGSFALAVTDLDAMHRELDGRGLDLGGIRIDAWGGKRYRVFFLREAQDGYCYCFSQPMS